MSGGPVLTFPITSRHLMPFSAEVQTGGSVRFSLWAPSHEHIGIELDAADAPLPMQRQAGG
jgi:1,4-alpha-glucan branching enzyme